MGKPWSKYYFFTGYSYPSSNEFQQLLTFLLVAQLWKKKMQRTINNDIKTTKTSKDVALLSNG